MVEKLECSPFVLGPQELKLRPAWSVGRLEAVLARLAWQHCYYGASPRNVRTWSARHTTW